MVYDIVNERILEALEKDIVPWRKTWKSEYTHDQNPVTGTIYRGVNTWLLLLSRYLNNFQNPYWYTFKQINKLGGKIKKGEKSTIVTFYKVTPKKRKYWTDYDQKRYDDNGEWPNTYIMRYYNVWNLDQIENIDSPKEEEEETPTKEVKPITCCEKVVKGYKDRPSIKFSKYNKPCYIPSKDEVHMPIKNLFEDSEEYYATLFHELGHSTGHKDRLDRLCLAKGVEAYAKEELVAEMVSAYLSGHCKIDKQKKLTVNTAAYIRGWKKAIKDDKYLFAHAAGAAQKATDYILGE